MAKHIYTERQQRLCTLLRAARKAAGLTQTQLADRLGTYKSYVSKYEKGERRLDVIEFIAVAEAIGVDPGQILKEVRAELTPA